MKPSIKTGFSFGLTSGIITTLGLIVGLNFSTHSKLAVIGGILVIAIADSLSDATGIHISEESREESTTKSVWEATIATLVSKFVFASSFIIPVFLLSLEKAVIASIVWGVLLISFLSAYVAKEHHEKPYKAVIEHLLITILVVIITYFVGNAIGEMSL